MKVLVVCAVVASCLASPSIGYVPPTGYSSGMASYGYAYKAPFFVAAPNAPVALVLFKTQHHYQDELGQASYGHSEPLQSHEAVQDAYGNKEGSFSYVDPHGAVHHRYYVADGLGVRVAGNDLPVAPAETPEVVAAKISHYAALDAALLHRRKRTAQRSVNNGGSREGLPIASLKPHAVRG